MSKNLDTSGLIGRLRPYFDRPEIRMVILFGSRATGAVHGESDLDLAVLADRPVDTQWTSTLLMRMLHANNIDLVDLRRASPLLARQIVSQGRLLYERDAGAFAAFASLSMRRYYDTRKLRLARQRAIERFLQGRGVT